MLGAHPMYLFDPATVEQRIVSLPRVAGVIHSAMRTGEASASFPKLQKTKREILRILGRAEGYAHLDALLRSLDFCLERGWDAHQLGARDHDEFASLMSELAMTETSLLGGFTIQPTVGLRIQGRKPDLFVTSAAGSAIVEVFRPRELQAFHAFERDV